MAFQQFKLSRVVNQTRGIFDKLIYNPDSGDTIADILVAGYFNESRYADDPDWVGSVVEVSASDGYAVIQIGESSTTSLYDSNVLDSVNRLMDETGVISTGNSVKALDPVDFYSFQTMAEFEGFGYGVAISDSAQIVRLDLSDASQENFGNPVPVGSFQNIQFLSDGTCFAEGQGGDNFYKLYRKASGQDDWVLVINHTISNVFGNRIRGICECDIEGNTVLIYTEYNVNNSRTPGSTNDMIRILNSTDMGLTWNVTATFNTDGSNTNIRHFHGVVQNPDDKRIFIMTGDGDSQSAIYSWDGVTPWVDNISPIDLVQSSGLKNIAGRQRFRCLDIIFDNGICYWMSDSETSVPLHGHEYGAWKCTYDLEDVTKISSAGSNTKGLAGRHGVMLSTGEIVYLVTNDEPETGFMYSIIVVSSRDKTRWGVAGAYRTEKDVTYHYRKGFFLVDDVVYVSMAGGSGKTLLSTVAIKLSNRELWEDFEGVNRIDTIHPVYWLDADNGNDGNSGYSPREPLKTMSEALTSGKLTYGARLVLPIGNYELENGITPGFTGNTLEGDNTEPLVIQGQGATVSSIEYMDTAVTSNMFLLTGSDNKRLELCDLELRSSKSTSVKIITGTSTVGGSHLGRLTRCFIEGIYQWGAMFESRLLPIQVLSSLIENYRYGTIGTFQPRGSTPGDMDIYCEKSVFTGGGRYATFAGLNNKISMLECEFINPTITSIRFDASTVVDVDFLRCGFWTAYLTELPAITDNSGGSMVWNRTQFAGCYGNAFQGVEAAFDPHSRVSKLGIPVINKADYIY